MEAAVRLMAELVFGGDCNGDDFGQHGAITATVVAVAAVVAFVAAVSVDGKILQIL